MIVPLKVAVAGLGTVGAMTLRLLQHNAEVIERRCGRRVVVSGVCARDRDRDRGVDITPYPWFDDPLRMATESQADVIIELIGGETGIAKDLCVTGLKLGKHVITANKALLAHEGTYLAGLAAQQGGTLAFEPAVAGGVPVIKTLKEGLAANHITEIHGILNGTCNYVLSRMHQTHENFAAILEQAQRLGYAEADPSLDINGTDTAHKLAILTAVAFNCAIRYTPENVLGIQNISPDDVVFAEDLGYRIRLLGIARLTEQTLEQRVHPCLLPIQTPLANVQDVFNAVILQGDFIDQLTLVGRGAGAGPTASAVVADLIDIARENNHQTTFYNATQTFKVLPLSQREGAYYLRLMGRDEVGVLANIAKALSDQNVSIEQFLQRRRDPGEYVPLVLTTHKTNEQAMIKGLNTILSLPSVKDHCLIRIEQF